MHLARLMIRLACAAASESIAGWRVKIENIKHKALDPQNVMELPHRGQLTMPVIQNEAHFHFGKTHMG